MTEKVEAPTQCGYVALVGSPNVGKSTLLNRLVGAKLSITSRKPQTTRQSIAGIVSQEDTQFVFLDTPGLHNSIHHRLNQRMNDIARANLGAADVVVFMASSVSWTEQDKAVIQQLAKIKMPTLAVINKVDRLDKQAQAKLVKLEKKLLQQHDFAAVLPISARHGTHVELLLSHIRQFLPHQAFLFDADEMTDKSERFLAAERVREKLFRCLGEEIPYGCAVAIESFDTDTTGRRIIHAAIFVSSSSHKPIVIGVRGSKLREIGTAARLDLQRLFDAKVELRLWVRVRESWMDHIEMLESLGF